MVFAARPQAESPARVSNCTDLRHVLNPTRVLEGHVRLPAAVIFSFLAAFSASARQAPPPPPVYPSEPQPPRDVVRRAPPPEPTGTGVIRGRVVASDTGNPIRRAMVNLSPIAPPMPPGGGRGASGTQATIVPGSPGIRCVDSGVRLLSYGEAAPGDDRLQGAFEFTGLAAGSYRISGLAESILAAVPGDGLRRKEAERARLVGPRTANSAGGGTVVRQGGHRAAARRGHHGARDRRERRTRSRASRSIPSSFRPAARAECGWVPAVRPTISASSASTDCSPASHAVVAEAMRYNFVPPNAPPETEEDKIGFVTTYYPGTAGRRGRAARAHPRRHGDARD